MGVGQTFQRMVGYVTKDRGQPHHQFFSHNVTDEEIALGQAEWEALKLHYMDGKIALNKANLFARAHTFFTNNITPETATFSQTLAKMMNTRKYMFAATLLMNSGGQMRAVAAEAYWELISGGDDVLCSSELVESIIYMPAFVHPRPPLSTPCYPVQRPAVRVPLAEFEALDGSGDEPAPAAAGGSGLRPRTPVADVDSDDELESTPRTRRRWEVIQDTIRASRARGRAGSIFIDEQAEASGDDAGDDAGDAGDFDDDFIDDRDEDDLSVTSN